MLSDWCVVSISQSRSWFNRSYNSIADFKVIFLATSVIWGYGIITSQNNAVLEKSNKVYITITKNSGFDFFPGFQRHSVGSSLFPVWCIFTFYFESCVFNVCRFVLWSQINTLSTFSLFMYSEITHGFVCFSDKWLDKKSWCAVIDEKVSLFSLGIHCI